MVLRGITNASRRMRKDENPSRFGQKHKRKSCGGHEREEEHYLGFQIVYQQRKLGVTMARTQHCAVISGDSLSSSIYLSGFPTQAAARQAARGRVDDLAFRQRRLAAARWDSPHR
jgi:hypothetical protein